MFRLCNPTPDSIISPVDDRGDMNFWNFSKSRIDFRSALFKTNDYIVITDLQGIVLDSNDEIRFGKLKKIGDLFYEPHSEMLRSTLLDFRATNRIENRLILRLKADVTRSNTQETGKSQ